MLSFQCFPFYTMRRSFDVLSYSMYEYNIMSSKVGRMMFTCQLHVRKICFSMSCCDISWCKKVFVTCSLLVGTSLICNNAKMTLPTQKFKRKNIAYPIMLETLFKLFVEIWLHMNWAYNNPIDYNSYVIIIRNIYLPLTVKIDDLESLATELLPTQV